MARTKSVSKAELIEMVAQETGMKRKDVKSAVDSLFGRMAAELNRGGKITITGFGTFEVRERQARSGVKPGTTDRVAIPAKKYPAFKPGKALKEQVK